MIPDINTLAVGREQRWHTLDADSTDLLGADRTPRELLRATTLLAVVVIAQLAAAHAFQLFIRPFWFDEWVTHLIASDPDPSRAARALSSATKAMCALL